MDAIIFFYKKRDISEPLVTAEEKEGYRLVKVGICGGENNWFGQPLPGKLVFGQAVQGDGKENADMPVNIAGENGSGNIFLRLACSLSLQRFFSHRKEKRKMLREELEKMELQRQYEGALRALEKRVEKLAQTILDRTEALGENACVYTDGVRSFLMGEGIVAEVWKKNWNMREFVDYREYRWARFLLPSAAPAHFVILGTAPCIPEVVKACARLMKRLRWVLREKDCKETVEDFVDDFYEDYGLAVVLQTVSGRNGFRSLCLEAVKPVCVLDFTDEVKFYWGGLAAGSLWLDFASVEAKERRMERLAPGISYVSLKKLWNG